jgi:hypothetical protein
MVFGSRRPSPVESQESASDAPVTCQGPASVMPVAHHGPATGLPQALQRRGAGGIDRSSVPVTRGSPLNRWLPLDQRAAVREYLEVLIEHAPHDEMLFCDIAEYYNQLRANRSLWPLVSQKMLSQLLVEFGCKRKVVDLRYQGMGRPTMIVIPAEIAIRSGAPDRSRIVRSELRSDRIDRTEEDFVERKARVA